MLHLLCVLKLVSYAAVLHVFLVQNPVFATTPGTHKHKPSIDIPHVIYVVNNEHVTGLGIHDVSSDI